MSKRLFAITWVFSAVSIASILNGHIFPSEYFYYRSSSYLTYWVYWVPPVLSKQSLAIVELLLLILGLVFFCKILKNKRINGARVTISKVFIQFLLLGFIGLVLEYHTYIAPRLFTSIKDAFELVAFLWGFIFVGVGGFMFEWDGGTPHVIDKYSHFVSLLMKLYLWAYIVLGITILSIFIYTLLRLQAYLLCQKKYL